MYKEFLLYKDYYKRWKLEGSFCPAIKENIVISGMGWNHITGGNGHSRTFKDISRRLKLLEKARYLLEISTTYQDLRKSNINTFLAIEAILESKGIFKQVRVVLKKDKLNRYIFYSVMGKDLDI